MIINVHTRVLDRRPHMHHATKDDAYEIKSMTNGHIAITKALPRKGD
jgi:hypothetical protein